MRSLCLPALVLVMALTTVSCATQSGYNTQRGAALGAVGGALVGQAIGRNTSGTLIGAAVGTLVGAIAGNAVDQDQAFRREAGAAKCMRTANASAAADDGPPPGEWVTVPGRWENGRWVPAHRAWVPVNP
jgi:hypothetical protein